MTTKKPTALIKNQPTKPKNQITTPITTRDTKKKKIVQKNQDANIKLSQQTKNQLEILMKLTDHSFGYEMIEFLIDNYVDNNLDSDKKRAFKALTSL